jgi:hypothetical protein
MGDHVHVWVIDGIKQALGNLGSGLAQAGVQTSNNKIQVRQHFIRVIKGAIGPDFHFRTLQDAKIWPHGLVSSPDFGRLLAQALYRQAIGDTETH